MIGIIAALIVGQTQPGLMSYDQAVRCAGVTQAASELEGGESARGQDLFDAALFWSLAAMQAAQARNRDPMAADRDQTRERIRAVRELNARDPATRETLARCLSRTPNLG